jgi:hypothetical protein
LTILSEEIRIIEREKENLERTTTKVEGGARDGVASRRARRFSTMAWVAF